MTGDDIRRLVQALPEAADWSALGGVFDRAGAAPHPDWELPLRVCAAVGGPESAGRIGAAAIACLQISIMLVDDILDDDPRGEHLRRGVGPTANLAQAFQAAAFRLLDSPDLPAEAQAAASAALARASLATAYGQQLDVANLSGEENYWRVVAAKSTPFYGLAYQLGALLGGAPPAIASALYRLGVLIGEIIQVEDDLGDALETPANPDWSHGRNNLLLLYAATAEHAEQGRFRELLATITEPGALDEAQDILQRSGAISFAAYQLLARYREARSLLAGLPLPQPEPLTTILDDYGRTLVEWLALPDLAALHALITEL
jgi:geranylgeranyl pyrophosphate synthase